MHLKTLLSFTLLFVLVGCQYSEDGDLSDPSLSEAGFNTTIPAESMGQGNEVLVSPLSGGFLGGEQNFDEGFAVSSGAGQGGSSVVTALQVASLGEDTSVTTTDVAPGVEADNLSSRPELAGGNPVIAATIAATPVETTAEKPAIVTAQQVDTPSTQPVTTAVADTTEETVTASAAESTEITPPGDTDVAFPVDTEVLLPVEPETTTNTVPDPVTNPPVIPRNNQNSPFGTNIAGIRDWITSQPFVDVFKSARAFRQHSSANIAYDANGWPKNLNGATAKTYLLTNLMQGAIPYGHYTVLYDGKGKVEYGGAIAKVIDRKAGKDIVDIKPGRGSLTISITQSDPADTIRNIRVIMPGGICENDPLQHANNAAACSKGDYLDFASNYDSIVFNPDFLRYMQSFRVLRFMDFMNTNNSGVRNWSDMNTITTAAWGSTGDDISGAPVEVMVDLANRMNADPWFCMPHLATDDYVAKFADYVRDNLKPGLKAYVEYSNEVWNGMFKQASYAAQQGMAMKLDPKSYNAQMKFHSKRSVDVFKIWEKRFNGTDRIIRVMGAHSGNPWLSDVMLLPFEDAYKYTDALAIAPYFGGDPVPLRGLNSVDSIFTKLKDTDYKQSIPRRMEQVRQIATIAKKYNVDLIAYEGGQHLVDWTTSSDDQHPNPLFYAANSDPKMAQMYKEYMQAWKDSGGKLFVHFTSPEHWSKYGSWGLKEYLNQPAAETPKYNAVMEFINDNPKWW